MMRVLGFIAMIVMVSAPRVADAADAGVHSAPTGDDNLRVYAFAETPVMTFVVDGGAPLRLPGMTIGFTHLEPGPHQVTVTLSDGSAAQLSFTLSSDDQIVSHGRRWWCLAAGRRGGQLQIIPLLKDQCKSTADAGPD